MKTNLLGPYLQPLPPSVVLMNLEHILGFLSAALPGIGGAEPLVTQVETTTFVGWSRGRWSVDVELEPVGTGYTVHASIYDRSNDAIEHLLFRIMPAEPEDYA